MNTFFGTKKMRLAFCIIRANILHRGMFFLVVVSVVFLRFVPAQAQVSTDSPPIEITEGWQYRWGDSPLNEAGVPIWIDEDTPSGEWKTITYKKGVMNPPDRHGKKELWLRVKLPEGNWRDAHIFINHVLFACEVYFGGQNIYQSEGMNEPVDRNSIVPRWHIVPIESDFQNEILYFRIYSDEPRIIGIEQVSIGSRSDFIKKMMEDEIQLIILGFLFIAIGLVPLLIFIGKHFVSIAKSELRSKLREEKIYFAFGFFALSIGMATMGESEDLLQLFFGLPDLLFFTLVIFSFFTPVGLCMYFEQIFGAGYKSIIRRLWQIHLSYAVVSIIILLLDVFPLSYLEKLSESYFILFFFTMLILLSTSIIAAIRGKTEARIITAGFVVLGITGLYDIIGGGFGLIPSWSGVFYPWGMLAFIFSLGFVLEHRFAEAHRQLQDYSKGLEIKVEERTQDLQEKNETLENTLGELKSTQSRLVQSEKMASLGKLAAGITHEINNPVGALKSTMDILIRCAAKMKQITESGETLAEVQDSSDFRKFLNILERNSRVALSAGDRIAKIVSSLKNFTRLDETEFQKADIHEGIESTLTLIRHEIREEIEVVKEFGDIPNIFCYPGELNQVFMTLLTNAVQAIENEGTVTIKTSADNTSVYVEISDTGRGIPPEQLEALFDLNFTTKKSRVGMGMGLPNAYNIIHKHNGEIKVGSEVGNGTKFVISLPIEQKSIAPNSTTISPTKV